MPDFRSIVRARLASLKVSPAAETDLIEELSQHLEDRFSDFRSAGQSDSEALRSALAELDDLRPFERSLERNRVMIDPVPAGSPASANVLEDLAKDVKYAFRNIRKNPLFALFVVLTLGLGIGANTTVFTILNTLILNPLPVPDSSMLAGVSTVDAKTSSHPSAPAPLSFPNLVDYQERNQTFASLAGYTPLRIITVETGASSERMFAELDTANYFETLGIAPSTGRFFLAEDDSTAARPAAVLNYGTWQARFGSAPDIVGRAIRINNIECIVVGVAPPGFIGVNAIFGPDFWIPASIAPELLPIEMQGMRAARGKPLFLGIGRLKPGIPRIQAQANLASIASALAHEYPDVNRDRTVLVQPLRDVVLNSSSVGSSTVVMGSILLLAVVGMVLLIACSNVANLLLARAAARRQEFAVRLAMGASRARLIRQLLTESVLLGLMSGLVGLALGAAGVQIFWIFRTPNFGTLKLDPPVFALTLSIALLTGFVFGTAPALRASKVDFGESLKEETRTVGRTRGRVNFSSALLVAQVAFSFVLLMTAALFLRSIGRAYQVDPGFDARRLATFMTDPGAAGYSKDRAKAYYKEIRERVQTIPGVASAAWSSRLPLWNHAVSGFAIEGRQARSASDSVSAVLTTVDPGFFETAGIPIESGRTFLETDRENVTPVAIVNRKLAEDYWPDQNPVGRRLQVPGEKIMRQVIGVARNANYTSVAEPPQPAVYIPLEQSFSDSMTLYVRTLADPGPLLLTVSRQMRDAAPDVLVHDVRTGRVIIDNGLFQAKAVVVLLTVFGLLALGLASIGLYGIVAYSVQQRTREIGVRMALGAGRATVLREILARGMFLVALGVVLGLATALSVGRLLGRLLYGVTPSDPFSIAAAALVLLLVALFACFVPARRASRLDPLAALREG